MSSIKDRESLDFVKKYIWLYLIPIEAAALISLTIFLIFKYLPTSMPLFYSLPWGENQLVTHQQFFIIPAIIILISLINAIFSWQLHRSQVFFKKALLAFSLIVTLILAITFIKIVLIFI